MATSKKTVTTVEESLDTTPEVMDFVESTPTEETAVEETPIEETPTPSGLVNQSTTETMSIQNTGGYATSVTDDIDPQYLQGFRR